MVAAEQMLDLSIKRENLIKRFVSESVIPQRFINFGRNTKLSKCIGIIGPRGSCKSIAAAAMGIVDYLIPGYKLISNMQVQWGIKVGDMMAGYYSDELDKMALLKFNIEDNVAALVDEVNIEFSEARRSMSNRNIIFNKILQQLRKRAMNVIYTVQHEMWIDNRLRWQTDIFIKTRDVCLKPGGIFLPYEFGEYASWRVYDMSGVFGQGSYAETMTPVIDDWRFNAKQWWNTFDTKEIQGLEQDAYGGDGAQPLEIKRNEYIVKQENDLAYIYDVFQKWHDEGITEVSSDTVWKHFGVKTHKAKTWLGGILKNMGLEYKEWKKSYQIPETDLTKPTTMKIPVTVGSKVEKEKDI